jgi:putative ABC transport system substrate-binding protein
VTERRASATRTLGAAVGVALAAATLLAQAQPTRIPRVGVVYYAGFYEPVIDGLRVGLKESALEEGRDFTLEIHDARGDPRAVEEAARRFEREGVRLIYALPTTVATLVKRATGDVPIAFCVGSDPVSMGLIESFTRPGGRITGVHYLTTDLTAKRLEILKELVPRLRRVITFYNPSNPAPREAVRLAREAGRHLGVELIERHAGSIAEFQSGLRALKAGEADAFFLVSDALAISQAQAVIDAARAIRMPTMFHEPTLADRGALASYGVNYYEIGRQSAKHVQRVLAGASPGSVPVENVTRIELVLNRRTAREIGLTIPPGVLARADRLIE